MKYLLLFAGLLLAKAANAQIVITYDKYLNIASDSAERKTYAATDTSLSRTLMDNTGQNRTWDLTPIHFEFIDTYEPPSLRPVNDEMPLIENYPTATHATVSTLSFLESYDYYQVDSTGVYSLGMVQIDHVNELTTDYPSRYIRQTVKFPLTYQTSWKLYLDADFNNDSAGIDGWGVITIPGFGTHKCLRQKEVHSQIIVNGTDTTKETWYQWWTETHFSVGMITSFSYKNNTETIGRVNYNVPAALQSIRDNSPIQRLDLTTNPAAKETNILLPDGTEQRLSICDALGKQVFSRVTIGETVVPIDVSNFPNGTYFVRAESNNERLQTKLLISH